MGLLRGAGYAHAVDYHGGLEEWRERGLDLERAEPTPSGRRARAGRKPRRSPALFTRLIDLLEASSPRQLTRAACLLVLGFAVVYVALCPWTGNGLVHQGETVHFGLEGLLTSIYFSVATATTLGYGDVVPVGAARFLAVVESIVGLLLFGAVLAKFLSRRQEDLVTEIARLTYEDRLGRMQAGLHTVIGDLIDLGDACRESGAQPARLAPRLESSVLVFASQLRGMYDLLFRPQEDPDEDVLEALLAALVAALGELASMLECEALTEARTPELDQHLARVSRLAQSICGDCVPREYAAPLKARMDRVRALANALA